jgi:hypothetical protein
VVAFPIVALRYPPMPDLAMHEAVVAVLRRLHDPSFVPPGMYFVVAPQANQLFHFLALGLSLAMPTDLACKLVVAASSLLGLVAMARLLDRQGRSTALAPLLAFVALGWCFRWGLVANLLGFALLLLVLPALLDLAVAPSGRRVLVCIAASVLLVFAHETAALAYAAVAVALVVFRMPESLRRPYPLIPAAVVLALAAAQAASTHLWPYLVGASMGHTGSDYGLEPWDRVLILPGAVLGGARTVNLEIEAGFCLVVLAIGGWSRARESAEAFAQDAGEGITFRHRFALLALFFLALYLLFPMSVSGSTLLAHRFLPPAFAFLVMACSPAKGARVERWLGAIALVSPVLAVTLLWPQFLAADRRARDLDVVLAAMPDDCSVAQLDLTPRPPSAVAPVPGMASRAQAVHGGRMLFGFFDQPPYPMYIQPSLRWNEPVERLTTMPYAFLPSVDGHRFAYLLVLESDPRAESLVPEALTPEYEPVRAQGQWQLFRSTLAVDPVDSPDRPLTAPPVDTLARRMYRLSAR